MRPVSDRYDVIFALTGDVFQNSRAIKQLRALRNLGCRVLVLSLGTATDVTEFEPGIHVRVFPHPGVTGPHFFWLAHRLFSEAADLPARVYHASDLYTLPALRVAARRHSGALVYDARELYPHVAATAGRPWVRLFWYALEWFNIRKSDAVFTVSDSIADRLAKVYGISRPTVLHNIPPARPVVRTDRMRSLAGVKPDSVLILHQGQMRKDRGCTRLVDAMIGIRGATLVFLGNGPLRTLLMERAEKLQLSDRIKFIAAVPPDELLELTASADIGVTLLEDTCLNHRFALPNKLFEYLMAGVPVLASDLPEIRHVIQSYEVGRVVDASDTAAVTRTLQEMVDNATARKNWSANTTDALKNYNWEKESLHFTRAYKELLQQHPATT